MSSPLFVLAASATEASEWKHSIWQQMLSATIPEKYSKTFFNKEAFDNETWPDGRAKYVPNGLRMVETLLLREYSEDDVVVYYVDQLEHFVGPETKVLAIHAHNPLGISYATDVYSKLGGENLMPVNAHEFIRIVTHPVIRKFNPKIVVGGPGAWQLEKANRLDEFRIDYLIDGEIERVFSDLFRRILASDPTLPRVVKVPRHMQPAVEEIPVVRHRSTFGVCEITRGCGRGCQFCSPATKVGRSFPLEHIIASAEVNAREGATEVMLASEDMFLYGAKLIGMTDLQWEFFFTSWKLNMEFWRSGSSKNLKFTAGAPIYYKLLGKKLFGDGIKYPLLRFAGVPDRLLRKRLYLDFTGYKRHPNTMVEFPGEIVPAFQSVRDRGLNMIDASA